MNGDVAGVTRTGMQIFDDGDHDDMKALAELRSDCQVTFFDQITAQRATLMSLRPLVDSELLAEPTRWVYYPWRQAVAHILGPRAFQRVRLDRNRDIITLEEQVSLRARRIGVVGLSVGHVIAHTLAAEGLCGQIRLADFDSIDLSNLNRVPASVVDLGVNKAMVAARRIVELDPYLDVQIFAGGITADTVHTFLDGLDVVVEECDSLDVKFMVREAARLRRIPVLMATSDRGLTDIERFDLEPERPLMHGLLGDLDVAQMSSLTNKEKIPHALRMFDAPSLSERLLAS